MTNALAHARNDLQCKTHLGRMPEEHGKSRPFSTVRMCAYFDVNIYVWVCVCGGASSPSFGVGRYYEPAGTQTSRRAIPNSRKTGLLLPIAKGFEQDRRLRASWRPHTTVTGHGFANWPKAKRGGEGRPHLRLSHVQISHTLTCPNTSEASQPTSDSEPTLSATTTMSPLSPT
jgi:hypothetical protein